MEYPDAWNRGHLNMKSGEFPFTQELRDRFNAFWHEHFQIEERPDGLALALPLMDANGWQIQLRLRKLSKTQWLATDQGQTLSLLEDSGKFADKGEMAKILAAQSKLYGYSRDGLELVRTIRFPFDPVEIQIFAEGLASLSHLIPKRKRDVVKSSFYRVEQQMDTYFRQRSWEPKRKHEITGQLESKVVVDFYLDQSPRALALQPVSRSKNLKDYMEQWGFRWRDLADAQPDLVKAMIFDPDSQEWDRQSLRIGEAVCDVFVPYTEADEALDRILVA
jgi:hypothetical protein